MFKDKTYWSKTSNYEPFWIDRARSAARLQGSAVWVCDIGCGQRTLKGQLHQPLTYLPADLTMWDDSVAYCDLNSLDLPHLDLYCADLIYILGVLEYLDSPERAIKALSRYSARLVLSYNPTELVQVDRASYGWRNSITKAQLPAMLADNGYEVKSCQQIDATQLLLDCQPVQRRSSQFLTQRMARIAFSLRQAVRMHRNPACSQSGPAISPGSEAGG